MSAGEAAHVGGQPLQRRQPVLDHDARRGGRKSRGRAAPHHDGAGAGGERRRCIRIAVEVLAAQADEEVAGREAAGVGADVPDHGPGVACL